VRVAGRPKPAYMSTRGGSETRPHVGKIRGKFNVKFKGARLKAAAANTKTTANLAARAELQRPN